VCGSSFDALAIVAAGEDWDLRRDFEHVLARLAELVGQPAAMVPLPRPTRPVREFPPREDVTVLWGRMAEHDSRSEAYLDSRGLLLHDPDLLRFSIGETKDQWIDGRAARGWRVAMPLRNGTGAIVDIGLRYLGVPSSNPREKALLLPGVRTKGLAFARPLPAALPSTLVVVEGMTDTLGATLLWPDAYVLGAPGGGMTAQMIDGYADLIRGRHVVIATDMDEAGNAYAELGIDAAWSCGVASVARGTPEIGNDIADEVLARRTVTR
jgi:hypothetical protein